MLDARARVLQPFCRMLAHCLHCYRRFPENQILPTFEIGRRVAFDPHHGRLWAVCAACGRWTLAPVEARWETLEQLERLTTGRARLLAKGENVTLWNTENLEIIRIGQADRREEAWWRYGEQVLGRRARALRWVGFGQLVAAGSMLLRTSGLFLLPPGHPQAWLWRARRRHFGHLMWRGSSSCSRCGHELNDLSFGERRGIVLEPSDTAFPTLWYPCPRCGTGDSDAGYRFSKLSAEHILRRMLAFENFSGGDEAAVMDACSWIERCGSAEGALQHATDQRVALGSFPRTHLLGLEIALTTHVERILRDMELRRLESRWREEEEIAAIIDRELTPP